MLILYSPLSTQPIYQAIHAHVMYKLPSHSLYAKQTVKGTTE